MERRIDDHDRKLAIEWFKPGKTLYTIVTNVSRSGMSRSIKVLITYTDGNGEAQISDISYMVARVLDWRIDDRHGGVKVSGCGMDMGFHLVNCLSYAMHGYPSREGKEQTGIDPRHDVSHGYTL